MEVALGTKFGMLYLSLIMMNVSKGNKTSLTKSHLWPASQFSPSNVFFLGFGPSLPIIGQSAKVLRQYRRPLRRAGLDEMWFLLAISNGTNLTSQARYTRPCVSFLRQYSHSQHLCSFKLSTLCVKERMRERERERERKKRKDTWIYVHAPIISANNNYS